MHRFYIPYPIENPCTLSEDESRHCIKVLRLETGSAVELTDGQGGLYQAVIAEPSAKACTLKITATHKESPSVYQLHIAVAPTKNLARMEWLVEKLTEIGIAEFIPFTGAHSERKVMKTERLKKIAVESMKQSGRTYLPAVKELIPFASMLKTAAHFTGQKFILHCTADAQNTFARKYYKGQNAFALIGPEGDFSLPEIKEAEAHGFIPISLGATRYRTETAALVAACALHLLNTT